MAEIFDFYVADNRTIKFNPIEPILQEDNGVAVWRFRIPKVLNNIDMSGFAWWFVYVNAAKQKYSEPLTLIADTDNPDNYCIADYTIDYGISLTPGSFTFALEAINANGSGEIIEEWHTKTYSHSVIGTLQGNQAEYSETESDIISALMVQIQKKYNALVGGATPIPVASISAMTDTSKIYLLTTDNNWYCYNGSTWVSGGQYASGIVVDPTLTQSGQAADAKVVGDEIDGKVSKPTSSPNGTAGQLLRTNGDGTTQWVDQGLPTDEQTAEAIDEWLTDHPEATTTVQDGSLTYKKLVTGTLGFVTPEMFGAVVDGVTDNSVAIQSAINYAVLFSMRLDGLNKQYIVSDAVSVPADISDTEKGLYVTGSLLMQNFKFKLKNDVSNLTSILNVHIPSGNTAIFENIEIDGNRQNQSLITTQSQNGGLHGFRIGKVGVNSGKVVIRNCRIKDCYTDGLCIRATKYDQMIVQGCIVETCGRNGFTDNAYSSLIDNCIITNNGTRVDPKSGYHIEPDSSFDFGVKRLINCIITDNVTNDFKIHFYTNAFNVQKVSIINCTLGVAAWANYEASACIHNNVEFINTTLKNGFIYSIPNPNGLSKLRSIIFENCDVDENLVINGSIDSTNPITSLTLNNCRFAKSVRLSRTFALITINKCSFVRSPISERDAIADNAIYVDYENSAETGKMITDFIVTDNYFFGVNRLFEIASEHSTIKRLVFGNNYAYNRTTILRNTGNIDVLLMNDNTFNIYGTVTRAVVQPNTCTNMIAKNNASNKSEALTFESPNVTTKIISDNIYGVT